MLVTPQSLHMLLMRLCWQMLAPPQFPLLRLIVGLLLLHRGAVALSLAALVTLAPLLGFGRYTYSCPQSLQVLLRRLCWQMPATPQSLQVLLRRL